MKTKVNLFYLLSLFIWFLLLTTGAYIAPYLIHLNHLFLFGPKWWQRLANFDGFHYYNLAKDGYVYGLYQSFFPGFPLLFHLFYLLIGGKYLILVGSLLNTCLFFITLFFLKKMGNRFQINYRWLCLFILFWPTSFYFLSFYTESLFLFLSVLAFYFYLAKKIKPALFSAALASGVRLVGVFLVIAFIGEYLFQNYSFSKIKKILEPKLVKKLLLWLIVGGGGLWLYMLFLALRFNDPLMFVHTQSKFLAGRETNHLIFLPQVFYRYFKMFLTTPIKNQIFFVLVLEVWTTLLAIIGLSYLIIKNSPPSLWIYGWLSLILPTLTGTLSSMPRYTLVIFPAFWGLTFLPKKAKLVIIFTNTLLLFFSWLRFYQGWWVA